MLHYSFKSMRITILVGTMTGTAQLCAQEMELALDDGERQVEALLMDGLDSSVFQRDGVRNACDPFRTNAASSPATVRIVPSRSSPSHASRSSS